jgi:hypothetical protein
VLFNDTIYYNINYGRLDASREEVEAAAKQASTAGRGGTALPAPMSLHGRRNPAGLPLRSQLPACLPVVAPRAPLLVAGSRQPPGLH